MSVGEWTVFAKLPTMAAEEKRIAEEDRLYKIQLAAELEQKAAERRCKRIRQFAMNCIYGIGNNGEIFSVSFVASVSGNSLR